jgi:hypothetical protein
MPHDDVLVGVIDRRIAQQRLHAPRHHSACSSSGQSQRIYTNITMVAPSSPQEAKESLRSGTNISKKVYA